MICTRRRIASRLAWLPGALLLAAASPPAAASAAEKARPSETPHLPIEHVTSELVLIEAYVTDLHGGPIRGLLSDNFVLMVDGKVAPIASLEFRELAPVEMPSAAPSEAAPDGGAGGPAGPAAVRRFVIFLEDDISAAPGLTMARRGVERFLVSALAPSDEIAVVAHAKGLRVLSDFTTDHEAVRRSVDESLRDPTRVSDFASNLLAQEKEIRDSWKDTVPGGTKVRSLVFLLGNYASKDATRVLDSMQALRSVVDALSSWPGYKAIVYMGDGISENPGSYYLDRLHDLKELWTNVDLTSEIMAAVDKISLSDQLKALVDEAGAGGVTIDTVETSGLSTGDASNTPAASVHRASSHRSSALATIALNTGGIASSSNDPLRGLIEAEKASRAYYLIGYAPEGPPDGRTHSVQLRVKKVSARLSWRRQFTRLRPAEARERVIRAAHLLPELYPNMGLELSVVPGPADRAGSVADLVVHVPPGQILFLPEAGAPTARLEVSLVAVDASHRETLRVARSVRVALKPGLQDPGALGLDLFHRALLPASAATITVVVDDLSGGSVGALRVVSPGTKRAPRSVLGLSIYSLAETSLWVEVSAPPETPAGPGEIPSDYSLGPALKTVFSVGEPLACGFRLPETHGAEPATFRAAIRQGGRTLKSVDAGPGTGGSGGAVKVLLPVAGLAPGEYLLVVQEVISGREIDRATLSFKLRPAITTRAGGA